jgi:hypothetical protein
MNRQSNRIKADRKHAPAENQASEKGLQWKPRGEGSLIRQEGDSYFLRESGEQMDNLILVGPETEILMGKDGRLFIRGEVEEYFDGKKWRPVGDDGKPTNIRRQADCDQEITPAAFLKKPEIDGSLIRRDGGALFLRETGEELDELSSSGLEELLKSKGGRFFLRIKHEEYFDGKAWLSVYGSTPRLNDKRRLVYQDKGITHAQAISWLFDNAIPSQMWDDFRPEPGTDHGGGRAFLDLETSIYKAKALLFLLSSEMANREEDEGGEGGAVGAGLISLCNDAMDALSHDFNASHEAWKQKGHLPHASAA